MARYYHISHDPKLKPNPPLNGSIHIECKTLLHVVSSAAEAEAGGIFHNAHVGVPIRTLLTALHHPQPPTPIKTDNSTAGGFIYNNIYQKHSKSWDMKDYWVRDRLAKFQFRFFWDKGINNHVDYTTKLHPTKHHRSMRPRYIQDNSTT